MTFCRTPPSSQPFTPHPEAVPGPRMLHPYQCIATIQESAQPSLLLAACGPSIVCSNLQNGSILSEWLPDASATTHSNGQEETGHRQRPTKKQKTSDTSLKLPDIIKLAVSPSKRHVVSVTDDKCLRVFERNGGALTELSQRVMPKRPCAVQFTPDSSTVLIGDKFGDVYSLPLLASDVEDSSSEAQKETTQPETQFKPSASNLTVHSKRNRDALAAQMQQKNFTPRKEALKFEHKLLLGHVSMLTDMKYAQYQPGTQQKSFVITADRDEHIRISRGPPQAHIIESFCLGHSEFVSKICQVGNTNQLVSGGGDPWLGVWQWWPHPRLLNKIDLPSQLRAALLSGAPRQLVVSGIWSARVPTATGAEELIVVACERVKGLLLLDQFSLIASDNTSTTGVCVALPSNPLDVAFEDDRMLVSVDSRQPSSDMRGRRVLSFHVFMRQGRMQATIAESKPGIKALNDHQGYEDDKVDQALDALIYGVADLRKRRDQEPREEDQGDGDA